MRQLRVLPFREFRVLPPRWRALLASPERRVPCQGSRGVVILGLKFATGSLLRLPREGLRTRAKGGMLAFSCIGRGISAPRGITRFPLGRADGHASIDRAG